MQTGGHKERTVMYLLVFKFFEGEPQDPLKYYCLFSPITCTNESYAVGKFQELAWLSQHLKI